MTGWAAFWIALVIFAIAYIPRSDGERSLLSAVVAYLDARSK